MPRIFVAAAVSRRRTSGEPNGVGSPLVRSSTPTASPSAWNFKIAPPMPSSASSGWGETTRMSSVVCCISPSPCFLVARWAKSDSCPGTRGVQARRLHDSTSLFLTPFPATCYDIQNCPGLRRRVLGNSRSFSSTSSVGVAMTTLFHSCGRAFQTGRWCLAAAVLAFGLCGCAGWGVRDDGFSDNDLSASARKARPPEKDIDYWSFSSKGQQIERDLHAQ